LAGGVPGQEVVLEGVKGVKYAPLLPEMYQNGEKNGRFRALSGLPKSTQQDNKIIQKVRHFFTHESKLFHKLV
jgi:hypothetical protein